MKIFRSDGHLRQEALYALAQNRPLEELERLEIAEHLAFCDLCLQRYTDALTKEPLLLPRQSCRSTVLQRIRSRALGLFTSRYATAAAAVALALTLVWTDIPLPERLMEAEPVLTETIAALFPDLSNFFDGLELPGIGGNLK